MAVFKRSGSDTYYMKFIFEGKQIFRSCKTDILAVAKRREADEMVRLKEESDAAAKAKREGRPTKDAPLLKDFARIPTEEDPGGEWWMKSATAKYKKPKTLHFYTGRTKVLLGFPAFADKPIDRIDEEDLDAFIAHRTGEGVKNSTIMHDLDVLKVIMNRAKRWKYMRDLPEFEKLKIDDVGVAITVEDEAAYLYAVDEDHQDWTVLCIETAIMPSSAAALRWVDVHFGEFRRWKDAPGYVYDRCEKTGLRKRELGMTPRLFEHLKARWERIGDSSPYVFPSDRKGLTHPTPLDSFQTTHQRLWQEPDALQIPKFRIYDFRHTALTRAREAGADAFDLQAMAGWTSSAMADRYIKNTDRARARNVVRLHEFNESERARVRSEN